MTLPRKTFFPGVFLLLLGACCGPALAGRPLMVDDANVNEAGHGQLEAWIARTGGSTVYNLAPAYAPLDGLEIGALLAHERNSSINVNALQAKWRLTPSKEDGCNFAAVAGFSHASSEGNTAYLNGLITCNQPALGSAHLNLGVGKARRAPSSLGWGVAYEKEIMGVTPHLEWFGAERAKPTVQVGLRGNVAPNLQLDGSLGRSAGVTLYTLGAKLTF